MTNPGNGATATVGATSSSPVDTLATSFTRLVGVRLPIVQTGMGWVSGASLTAATAAAGGLGILAAATLDRDAMMDAVDRVRRATDEPIGVNLRPDQTDLESRLDDLVAAGITIVSFAGPPSAATVRRLHENGTTVVVTVGARRHAEKMLDAGVDLLIAQGAEGGGHTGSVPSSILLPDVLDAVAGRIPVLAAGGYRDGRGLAAALTQGAAGVAMGTRFLLTRESRVPDDVKSRYLAAGPNDTMVTSALDGAPQRVIATDVVRRLDRSSRWRRLPGALRAASDFRRVTGASWTGLVREGWAMRADDDRSLLDIALAAYTPVLTKAALVSGDMDAGVLPTGQVVGSIDDLPSIADLVERMESEARALLGGRDEPTGPRIDQQYTHASRTGDPT